jgi:phosphatidate cytidylyltransferase
MGFSGIGIVCTVSAVVLLGSLVFYSRDRQTEGVAAASGATLLAFVYLGLMGGFLIVLRREHSAWLVLGIVLVTKSFDIGAYFTGRFFGRRKLIQWLSPGKTWEGLLGGLVVASLVGALGAWFVGLGGVHVVSDAVRLRVWQGAAMGLVFGLVGQAGDLFASLLKRDAGIKDAGRRLPGFGGVLDVIDSPIVVAPVAWWVFAALARMG